MKKFQYCLVALLMFATAACNKQKAKDAAENKLDPAIIENEASAHSANPNDNAPVFSFTSETHDFGTIIQGEKVSYAFTFTNTGKTDLLIRSANGSCGCTVPEYPKEPVKPGQSGVINVTFDSAGKEGNQNKTITLIANTIPNTKVLTITGEVNKQ